MAIQGPCTVAKRDATRPTTPQVTAAVRIIGCAHRSQDSIHSMTDSD